MNLKLILQCLIIKSFYCNKVDHNLAYSSKINKIRKGNIDISKEFLIENSSKNLKSIEGKSALRIFIEEFCSEKEKIDYKSFVEIIRKEGIKYNFEEADSSGDTILHYIAKNNLSDLLELLLIDVTLKKNISELIFECNKEGLTPVAIAIDKNFNQISKLLKINNPKMINKPIDVENNTSLMRLIISYPEGNSEIFKLFFDEKVLNNLDIENTNKYGENILSIAIKYNFFYERLIPMYSKKSILDKVGKDGYNPLIIAIKENNLDAFKLLIKLGADPLKIISSPENDLDSKKINSIKMHFHGANALTSTFDLKIDGSSPFSIALILERDKLCDEILQNYPDMVNKRIDSKENTSLILAILKGRENFINSLLKNKNIDLSLKNLKGEDALTTAIRMKRSDLLEKLITADVDFGYELNSSYLIVLAAHLGLDEAIEVLLAADIPKEQISQRISKKTASSLGGFILSKILSDKITKTFLNMLVKKDRASLELSEEEIEEAYSKINEVAAKGKWILRRKKYLSSTLKSYKEILDFFTTSIQRLKEKCDLEVKFEKSQFKTYILEDKELLLKLLDNKIGSELDSLYKIITEAGNLIHLDLNSSSGLRNKLNKIKKDYYLDEFNTSKLNVDKNKFIESIEDFRKSYNIFLAKKQSLELALKTINSKIRKIKNPMTPY